MTQINIYNMTPDEKRGFLRQFPASVFYEAAKMAGFKLPVGRPALDPSDSIFRLVSVFPAVANATVSRLNRQYPNGYTTDIPDEWDDRAPVAPPPTNPVPAPAIPAPAMQPDGFSLSAQTWDALRDRVSTVEERYIDRDSAIRLVNRTVELADSTKRLTARIDALEKQAPVIIQTPTFTSTPITGQHAQFPRMVKWLTLRHHVLLIGPAGTGKTSAAIAFAEAMQLPLYSQPLSLDSTAVLGFVTATGGTVETEFSKAWTTGGVFLWDELTMSAPDAVGALNAALANGFCTIASLGMVKAHPDFYCIAGDNSDTGASMEYSARSVLDGATLDRFRRIDWPIDLIIEERVSAGHVSWLAAVRAIRAFIKNNDIAHVGATMRGVIAGASALSSGQFTRTEILEDTMRKGVLCAEWHRVTALSEVRNFLQGV